MNLEDVDDAWYELHNPKMSAITKESVRGLQEDGYTRRICFATHMDSYFKKRPIDKYSETLTLPFSHGIKWLYSGDLFRNKRSENPNEVFIIFDSHEFKVWAESQGGRVFFRDSLSISLALSFNFESERQFSSIGALESRAKAEEDRCAVEELANNCAETIRELNFYKDTCLIAAVPTIAGIEFNLPREIVRIVAARMNLVDIGDEFSPISEKGKLEGAVFDEEWKHWESTDLVMSKNIAGSDVILIDDFYQSGTTLQFVAMKLQEAGARNVFGLCLLES